MTDFTITAIFATAGVLACGYGLWPAGRNAVLGYAAGLVVGAAWTYSLTQF